MLLVPGMHLVASGGGGFNLTDPFDCHVYLVDGGGEAALVDTGIGSSVDAIVGAVAAAGVELDAVRYILLTHAHPDHSGGAAELVKRLPRATVLASPEVARWVADGDEEAMSLANGKRAEFYPADYRVTACPGAEELREGERVWIGDVELTAIETPGHADGHLAFRGTVDGRTVLFSGDLLFYGGRIGLANNWDCRIQAYAASMAKLADAGVDVFLPGHHSLSLQDGQRHIDTANRLFANGFVPPSVV